MKKIICMFLLVAIAMIPLCACATPGNSLSGTVPDTQPDATSPTQPDTTEDNVTTDQTEATEEIVYKPYEWHEIIDDRITFRGTKKTYRDNGIAVSVPADWNCTELNGEDGSSFDFHPPLPESEAQLIFGITFSVYAHERTEDEYLEYFSDPDRTDVKIKSITKEMLSGYTCTKVVSSYSSKGTEYIRIDYDNIVTGVRLYDFIITYPASESATFETLFASIMNSLELTPV